MKQVTEKVLYEVLAQMQTDGEVECYGHYLSSDSNCKECVLSSICIKNLVATKATKVHSNITKNTEGEIKMAEEELVREDFEEMDAGELEDTCKELEIEAVYKGKGKKKKLDEEATIDAIMEELVDLEDEEDSDEEDSDEDEDEDEEGSDEDDDEDDDDDDDDDDDENEDLTEEDLKALSDEDLIETLEDLEIQPKYTGRGKNKKLSREVAIKAILEVASDEEDDETEEVVEEVVEKKTKKATKAAKDKEDEDWEEEGKSKTKAKEPKEKKKKEPKEKGVSIESIIIEELKTGGTVNEITERVEPLLEEAELECRDVKMRVRRSTHYAGKLEGYEMFKDTSQGRGNTHYQLVEEGEEPSEVKEIVKEEKKKPKTRAKKEKEEIIEEDEEDNSEDEDEEEEEVVVEKKKKRKKK